VIPTWWNWELEITSHLEKRMYDRDFGEIELRTMFENALEYSKDVVEGRWMIKTKHKGKKWEIIIEPDIEEQLLVVITAYPKSGE
jgi:protease II